MLAQRAALRYTEQALVAAPVTDPLPQETALRAVGVAGVPVPLRPTTVLGLLEELLMIVSWPVAAPIAAGLNSTLSVMAWLGFNVAGNVAPEIVKPDPESAAALMVTGAFPVDVRTRDCIAGAFIATLPKARLLALMVKAGEAAFNCS
jgi:hypothetical protein